MLALMLGGCLARPGAGEAAAPRPTGHALPEAPPASPDASGIGVVAEKPEANGEAYELAGDIHAFYEGKRSISARFVRRDWPRGVVAQGRLVVARPARFVYRYESGDWVHRNAGAVRTYDEGEQTIHEGDPAQNFHALALSALTTDLRKSFDLRPVDGAKLRWHGRALVAIPRRGGPVTRMFVYVSGDSPEVKRVLLDAGDCELRFDFKDVMSDVPMSELDLRPIPSGPFEN